MFTPKSHVRSTRMPYSGALATCLVLAACGAPRTGALAPVTGATITTAENGTLVRQLAPATAEEVMKAAIQRYYPAVLDQGVGRRTHVYFIANAQGEMEEIAIDTDAPVYGNITKKTGMSGGQAAAGLLTGGISLLATGLSRKELTTQAHCSDCGNSWVF